MSETVSPFEGWTLDRIGVVIGAAVQLAEAARLREEARKNCIPPRMLARNDFFKDRRLRKETKQKYRNALKDYIAAFQRASGGTGGES